MTNEVVEKLPSWARILLALADEVGMLSKSSQEQTQEPSA
jgi:hypothetical protein